MPFTWDPTRYLTYADERGRPFVDLLARIDATSPATVVDLGCGPGRLTRLLSERWPDADVLGLDSSPEMIARARADRSGPSYPAFEVADLRDWRPPAPVDIVVSNATLQWVDGHLHLLPGLLGTLAPGGWLAFQVPGNVGAPSHELRRELAQKPAYAAHTTGLATPASHDPADYYDVLCAAGAVSVDVWETTYTHVLSGPDPVFAWVSATGARPTLQALPEDVRADFEREFKARLAAAYPTRADGTVLLPFRRVFAVAQAGTPPGGSGSRGWA